MTQTMNLFTHRSFQNELLDGINIPFEDIRANMKELEMINGKLGGHKITIAGFKKLAENKRRVSVCEIGCGGGDNLKAIAAFAKKRNIDVQLTGVDINNECVAFAKQADTSGQLSFIVSDYRTVTFDQKPDILFSSLFCHHFGDAELVEMLKWMQRNCGHGFFINDLQRHPVAYFSIKWITKFFSRSYLVKNDAPLSVLRGFKKKEWLALLEEANVKNYSVRRKWAFRHLVVVKKNATVNM